MPSSPKSQASDASEDIEISFDSPDQVSRLHTDLVNKLNDLMGDLELYEMIDDDFHELRDKKLDQYEFNLLAEAYEAAGNRTTAEGCRNQAEECEERIEELQQSLDNMNATDIKEHMMKLYELEIRRETYEIQIKACLKYLEKTKRKAYVEAKKTAIRPASPRRYNKAASPSRLASNTTYRERTPERTPPRAPEREKTTLPLPSKSLLPLPAPKK